MAIEVIMPKLGMTMEEGTIIRWLKEEGERVEEGEPLLEVMTDKVSMEVEAPGSGILRGVLAHEGDVVPVIQAIAYLCAPGEEPSSAVERLAKIETPAMEQAPLPAEKAVPPIKSRVRASPAARRLAQERGIDLSKVKGTGPGGRITRADVEAFTPEKPLPRVAKVIPLSGIRRTIAERMRKSAQEAPHITLTVEVDMGEAGATRGGCSYTALIVYLVARILKDHPLLNASLRGDEILLFDEANIGVAVAMEEGLIVPVIKGADTKTLAEIDAEIEELARRAREGELTPDEVTGGTFTVSNLGMYDVDQFTAIINPPESAILAVGRVVDRAVVINGRIVVRPVMSMTLSADHRVLDGAVGARFLRDLKAGLENPHPSLR